MIQFKFVLVDETSRTQSSKGLSKPLRSGVKLYFVNHLGLNDSGGPHHLKLHTIRVHSSTRPWGFQICKFPFFIRGVNSDPLINYLYVTLQTSP